ncbi:MAG: ATP-binding protein [Elainellaceae cyanobacterium]
MNALQPETATSLLNVLVVEDEMAIATDIHENLESCGYRVVGSATSGEVAAEQVMRLRPDVVLMDIVLAGQMDGVATAHQIWTQFRIPVVYLTAHGDEQTLKRTKETNAFGYVLKPFSDNSLRVALEIAIERYNQEKQLHQQAQDASNRCKTYTAIASHEFRNFLTTIQSSVDVLEFELNHPTLLPGSLDIKLELIQMIQDSVLAFNEMIGTTLSFAKANDQDYTLQISTVNCVELCKTLIQNLGISQQKRILFFHYEAVIDLELDPNLFTFIFNNLISNALKYSPSETQIILTISKCDGACILRVKDYGIGIPEEAQKQIFEPFQRAANTGSVPGTGVGLSTVARCVRWLNGSIELDSQVGKGSIFTIRLPLAHKRDVDS